jgi:hypothetical protein
MHCEKNVEFLNDNLFFIMAQQPLLAKASSLSRIHDYAQIHHTWQDSSGGAISPT